MARREGENPELSRAVERQLRSWEIGQSQHVGQQMVEAGPVLDFVTISNSVGAGGQEIATCLSKRLGWPVFDKNILQVMAGDDAERAQRYRSLDERAMGWFEGMMRFLLDHSFVRDDYYSRLTLAVNWLARQERSIFLGRFADLILPKDRGIRVKVVAPPQRCVENFARHSGVSLDEARAAVQRIEQERADFVSARFRGALTDYDRFDLLISSERLTTEQAVELIVQGMELRGCSFTSAE